MSKLLQPVELSKRIETEKVNMKDIFAGNDDNEKEHEDKDETEKKTESNSEATIKQDEKKPLNTGVEKDNKNGNQEEDDETEE